MYRKIQRVKVERVLLLAESSGLLLFIYHPDWYKVTIVFSDFSSCFDDMVKLLYPSTTWLTIGCKSSGAPCGNRNVTKWRPALYKLRMALL